MKKLGLILLFLSNIALADIGGNWIGQGEWTYQGSGTHCFMNMSFKDNTKYLERVSGYFDCDMVGLDITPAKFVKNGTDLLNENGEVVGNYIGNTITLVEDYSDTVKVHSTIKVDNLHFDYDESWIGSDGEEIYHINGRMFTNRDIK